VGVKVPVAVAVRVTVGVLVPVGPSAWAVSVATNALYGTPGVQVGVWVGVGVRVGVWVGVGVKGVRKVIVTEPGPYDDATTMLVFVPLVATNEPPPPPPPVLKVELPPPPPL
jgi:hypothetical protein